MAGWLARQTDGSGDVTDEVSQSARSILDNVGEALPRVGIAAVIIAVGYVLSRLVRRVARKGLQWDRYTPSFRQVMSKLAGWMFLFLAVLVALAVTFPSIQPVDLLTGLGIFSVALGFAFQDILENTLAGVLLLFRQPFRAGDQISVMGQEGTVEGITIRETRIRQYDGQLLIVPNRDVYKNVIRVQTSQPERMVSFVVGVAYETDLDNAKRIAREALLNLGMVADEPAPQVLVKELSASTVDLVVRFWAGSRESEGLRARDEAIATVKEALDAADIRMPTQIVELRSTA